MQYKAEIFDQKYSSLLQKALVESVKKPMLLEDALNIKGFLHSFAAEDLSLADKRIFSAVLANENPEMSVNCSWLKGVR